MQKMRKSNGGKYENLVWRTDWRTDCRCWLHKDSRRVLKRRVVRYKLKKHVCMGNRLFYNFNAWHCRGGAVYYKSGMYARSTLRVYKISHQYPACAFFSPLTPPFHHILTLIEDLCHISLGPLTDFHRTMVSARVSSPPYIIPVPPFYQVPPFPKFQIHSPLSTSSPFWYIQNLVDFSSQWTHTCVDVGPGPTSGQKKYSFVSGALPGWEFFTTPPGCKQENIFYFSFQ